MANALIAFPTGRQLAREARRVVVKLGTAVLAGEDGGAAPARVHSFVESLAALRRAGREVLLVSSGAVKLGAERLGVRPPPPGEEAVRACGAVGQGRLMACYAEACDRVGVAAAQLLIAEEDLARPRRVLNLRRTLLKLLELGALPVINENDAVWGAEIGPADPAARGGGRCGDNDRLAALVAARVAADLLVILTDVPGLLTADPRGPGRPRLIPVVRDVTPTIERAAGGPRLGRGGMRSKLEAARIATSAGCAVVVADGRQPGVIERVCAGEAVGTLFMPRRRAGPDA